MAFQNFTTIITKDDPNLTKVQRNIQNFAEPIAQNTRLDSHIIKNQTLNIGLNLINHGLSNTLQGYATSIHGIALTWDAQADNPIPNKTLWLYSSDNVVADIEVW